MKIRRQIYLVAVSALLFAAGLAFSAYRCGMVLMVLSFVTAGFPVIRKAIRNIGRGQVFDENLLMSIATLGALALQQYSEAAGVMLFYQVGELFQNYAVNKSRRSVAALMDIRPDYANLRQDGSERRVSPEQVNPGDFIVVKAGERIPLDGIVTEGRSLVDTAALTGEPVPREVAAGSEVISGCVNLSGILVIRVCSRYGESTVARLLEMVENASSRKAKAEQFITRFARYYTPGVVAAALAIAFIPPLLFPAGGFEPWIYRALTFLVISCPCALVISVPLSFFGGIGAASRNGILVKGSNYLQALAEAETVVFDKTGTLTEGSFQVREIFAADGNKEKVLELAAYAGVYSGHPVSQSICRAWGRKIDKARLSGFEEKCGRGVQAKIDGCPVLSGNAKLMEEYGIEVPERPVSGTTVAVAAGGVYAGQITIDDRIKPDAQKAVKELRELGVRRVVMLSGDHPAAAERIGREAGISEVYGGLLPGQKVAEVEKLTAESRNQGRVVFVGDGINDAPVLARADIGIAMGGVGSDAAVEAADVVIMTDEPSKVAAAVKIARRTLRIVKQNIVFALGVKAGVLILGALGMATMWEAVFADVGVSVLAILNAMRALRFKA